MRRRAWIRSALLLGGVTSLLATGCGGGAPAVNRVVVVSFDTTRADRLGCYGYEDAETPNVDALAAEAALFDKAVSPVPTTLPSHSTMFTGVYPQDHGVRYNLVFRLGPDAVTLAETLRDAGFATAGFPASYVLGERFGLNQGFGTYSEPPAGDEAEEGLDSLNGVPAEKIVDRALAWLDAQADSNKQFVWLHFYDPHAPYSPPFPYSSKYRDRRYDGELAYADAHFGRLMQRLRTDPAWAHTMVVVVGDHGEGLYDHGERFHANLVYESTQHVPLIIRVPGGRALRLAEPVSLVDITPTVLDYVGIDSTTELRGISLRQGLEGDELPRRDIYFESLAGSLNYGWAEQRGLRYGDWKLIDSDDPELFDLASDPKELNNLADLESQRLEDLRATLSQLQEPLSGDGAAQPAYEPVTDPETEAFLASLGYVAGGAGGSATGAIQPRDQVDIEAELLKAQTSVADRDWVAVEEVCRYVLGRDERNKWALSNLSVAFMWTDRPVEAQDHALELIRIYPDNERGYTTAARAYKMQEQTRKSLEVLGRGLEKLPDSVGLRYLHLVAGFDLGIEDVCPNQVPLAVDQHPESGLIRMLRSRCEAIDGQAEQAMATLKEAVELGFTGVEQLEEAEEFSEVVQLEEFRTLIDSLETGPDSTNPE
jgi:arylsulfatase A-like enzyme